MCNFARLMLIVGLVFSALGAMIAAGTTYEELYEDDDDDYKKREAIHSGIFAFIFLALLSVALIFLLPLVIK